MKLEREQCQKEVRDLQEQLSEMHDELDGAKRAVIDLGEKDAIIEVNQFPVTISNMKRN